MGNFHGFVGQAINLGLTTVDSECVGAGDYKATRYYTKRIIIANYVIMDAVNLLLILPLPTILHIYNTSPEAEHLARTVALIHGISVIFIWTPSFMLPTALRAAGDARFTMGASMATMWFVRVGMAYVIGKFMGYGIVGVWSVHATLDWSARSVFFIRRYRSGKWMAKAVKG